MLYPRNGPSVLASKGLGAQGPTPRLARTSGARARDETEMGQGSSTDGPGMGQGSIIDGPGMGQGSIIDGLGMAQRRARDAKWR